jgi:hypothetical protein
MLYTHHNYEYVRSLLSEIHQFKSQRELIFNGFRPNSQR